MADKVKLTTEQQWLGKEFGVDVDKAFLSKFKKESEKAGFDKRIAAFHLRWDDYSKLVDFLYKDKEIKAKCEKENTAHKTLIEAIRIKTEVKKHVKEGDLFKAHLDMDAELGDIETHLIMGKYPFPMKSKKVG